jgi:hypothetical protein
MSRLRVALLFALAVACASGRARACAACGCGDPTLVSAGTEQPFAGRLRTSLELRYRTDSIGEPGVDRLFIREARADLSLAYAPFSELFLMATLPFVHRSVEEANLANERTWGPGDAELRAKLFVYRDRELAARVLVAANLGVKMPTAPFHQNSAGQTLPLEAQPGTGSLDVLFGPSLALVEGKFSAYASAQLSLPVATRDVVAPGISQRSTLALQYQPWTWLALRPAADSRWDTKSKERGRPERDSGGFVLFLGGDALVSPLTDLTLTAGVRAPVWQVLDGFHDEGAVGSLSAALDF